MRYRYLVLLLAFLLVGCVNPSRARSPKPGTNYVDSNGAWIEVGSDGRAHQVMLPLDQLPAGMTVPHTP